jgi:hypothetical protein
LLTRTESPNLEAAFKLSNAADDDDLVMDSFLPFMVTERTLLLSRSGEMPGSSSPGANASVFPPPAPLPFFLSGPMDFLVFSFLLSSYSSWRINVVVRDSAKISLYLARAEKQL